MLYTAVIPETLLQDSGLKFLIQIDLFAMRFLQETGTCRGLRKGRPIA